MSNAQQSCPTITPQIYVHEYRAVDIENKLDQNSSGCHPAVIMLQNVDACCVRLVFIFLVVIDAWCWIPNLVNFANTRPLLLVRVRIGIPTPCE